MATSGYISYGNINSGVVGDGLKLSWKRVATSIPKATSTLEWTFEAYSDDSAFQVGKQHFIVKIDGQEFEVVLGIGWISKGWRSLGSGTIDIKHNSVDSIQDFSLSFEYVELGLDQDIASGTGTIDAIYKPVEITSAPNFTDIEEPTITFATAGGTVLGIVEACISLTGAADDIKYREIDTTKNTYTFTLTDAERLILREAVKVGNSVPVRFYIRNKVDGVSYWSYLTKTMTLTNYEPTLAPTIKDINSRTVSLTGNANSFIKYHSNAYFNTGAAAKKGAAIDYQTIINGSTTLEDYTANTGTIEAIDSNTFYFTVADSRGNVARDAVVVNLVPYVKLTASLETGLMSASGSVTFTVRGKYYNGSFGAKNNSLEVEYLVRDINGNAVFNSEGSGWTILGVVTPTVDDNNNYSYTHTITGLDYNGQYEITVNVIDELTPVQSSSTVVQAIPVFDWGANDFHHHTRVDFEKNIHMKNNTTLRGEQADGSDVQILGLNSSNHTVLGWGGYDKKNGDTAVYGNNVRLNFNNNLLINNTALKDFIIEEASNGTWHWRKWYSGRVELDGYQNITSIACNTALGGLYRTAVQTAPSFPFAVYNPKVVSSYESNGFGALIWNTTLAGTNKPADFYLIRPTSSAAITGKVNYYVSGTWK